MNRRSVFPRSVAPAAARPRDAAVTETPTTRGAGEGGGFPTVSSAEAATRPSSAPFGLVYTRSNATAIGPDMRASTTTDTWSAPGRPSVRSHAWRSPADNEGGSPPTSAREDGRVTPTRTVSAATEPTFVYSKRSVIRSPRVTEVRSGPRIAVKAGRTAVNAVSEAVAAGAPRRDEYEAGVARANPWA